MVLLILNSTFSLILVAILVYSYIFNNRGTNTAARFVRDTVSNGVYVAIIIISIIIALLEICIAVIFQYVTESWFAYLPWIVPIILSFYFQHKSTVNTQRIHDSRVVTKGAGEFVSNAAVPIAATAAATVAAPAIIATGTGLAAGTIGAAAAVGGLTATATGAAVAAIGAGTASAAAGDMVEIMDDVEAPDFVEVDYGISDALKRTLLRKAEMLGFHTEMMSIDQVCDEIVSLSSPAHVAELPEDMDNVHRAIALLGIVAEEEESTALLETTNDVTDLVDGTAESW